MDPQKPVLQTFVSEEQRNPFLITSDALAALSTPEKGPGACLCGLGQSPQGW